ncbi:MAG: class I SAM-dependent methyltransferase [Gemmatimonadetes bacterium]|nr:class I SAM-dependent methyltransferase [Gemmatimonadota bacterium]
MNSYSQTWFETFLHSVPVSQSDEEVAFLLRSLPVSRFPRVLDVCCGAGRHAVRLARAGYRVTGLDRDSAVLHTAETVEANNPRYVTGDMRDLEGVEGPFDAALLLWQSFGYFPSQENDAVLSALASQLRDGGRLILDLYHREFFAAHQGTVTLDRIGQKIVETKSMEGRRLRVHLDYGEGRTDEFSWELFTPEELAERAARVGFHFVEACSGYDKTIPPAPDRPRFQAIFEKA